MEGLTTHCRHEPSAKAAFCLCPAILAARKRVNVLQVCILVKYHQRTFSFETPHKLCYAYQHIDAAFTRFRLMLFVMRLPNPLSFYLLKVIAEVFYFPGLIGIVFAKATQ